MMSMTLKQAKMVEVLTDHRVTIYKLINDIAEIGYCIVMSSSPTPVHNFESTVRKEMKTNSKSAFTTFIQEGNVKLEDIRVMSIQHFTSQSEAAKFKNSEMYRISENPNVKLLSELERSPIKK
jgi:hypothetical protein